MRRKKGRLTLMTILVVLMALSFTFVAPCGAILADARQRYQNDTPMDWGDDDEINMDTPDIGASIKPLRVLASAALSDILPVNDLSYLDVDMDT
ncbi:MAG: hypothetical protein LLF96_09000, partial [Eubacteriales bacterium]|nr:hypothetical protein [Eubacteriales bacterium]